jgi:hypothetical protein
MTWQCQLKENCKHIVAYSVAINGNTDVKDTARPADFIRDVNEDFELVDEILKVVTVKGKAGADKIFS